MRTQNFYLGAPKVGCFKELNRGHRDAGPGKIGHSAKLYHQKSVNAAQCDWFVAG